MSQTTAEPGRSSIGMVSSGWPFIPKDVAFTRRSTAFKAAGPCSQATGVIFGPKLAATAFARSIDRLQMYTLAIFSRRSASTIARAAPPAPIIIARPSAGSKAGTVDFKFAVNPNPSVLAPIKVELSKNNVFTAASLRLGISANVTSLAALSLCGTVTLHPTYPSSWRFPKKRSRSSGGTGSLVYSPSNPCSFSQ